MDHRASAVKPSLACPRFYFPARESEARQGLPVEPVAPLVPRDVEFTSIAARGQMAAPVTLVRAEIIVDGGQPPDRRAVRYFRVLRCAPTDSKESSAALFSAIQLQK
jgi:hypothetical protein